MALDIKFDAVKKKVGNSFFFLVPMGIAELLDNGKEYSVIIVEKGGVANV